MKIGFRVDSARHIGSGHLQRCLTLARYLRNVGHECIFYSRNFEDGYYDVIRRNDFIITIIGHSEVSFFHSEKDWIGVDLQKDIDDFLPFLKSDGLDVCVVDHYSIDSHWELQVKPYVSILMVIDDLANRKHYCDILLDQNYFPNFEVRYDALVSDKTKKLLGPTYCLLREEFFELRNKDKCEGRDKPLILINFGGVGQFSFLKGIILTLNRLNQYDFMLVTGKLSEEEYLYLQENKSSHISLMLLTNDMAKIMQSSQFAIGACGSTVWERFCLGLNSGLVEVADNQKELLSFLSENELIDKIGSYLDFDQETFFSYMDNLDVYSESYRVRRSKIMALVDGMGVIRVANALLENFDAKR